MAEILDTYPYLERQDIRQALQYAAWLAEEAIYPFEPVHQCSFCGYVGFSSLRPISLKPLRDLWVGTQIQYMQ